MGASARVCSRRARWLGCSPFAFTSPLLLLRASLRRCLLVLTSVALRVSGARLAGPCRGVRVRRRGRGRGFTGRFRGGCRSCAWVCRVWGCIAYFYHLN